MIRVKRVVHSALRVWTLSLAVISERLDGAVPTQSALASIALDGESASAGPRIPAEIYGHFAEHLGHGIYGGIWVGPDSPIPKTRGLRNDVIDALRKLHIPVLRWPGGCFADEYHWKDGIGPRDQRPTMINTTWGGVVENNHFGTHEFMDFCELIGAKPYVCVNVGSGSVQEAMEWIEYLTSAANSPMANLRRAHGRAEPWRVPYVAVGNESWGCGGNMRPEYYADLFRRYNTFIKDYDRQAPLFRVAGGANAADYRWTEVLMRDAGDYLDGLSLHYYTIPTKVWRKKGSSTEFQEDLWFATLKGAVEMDDLIAKHSAIMDKYDAQKRVALIVDEWGNWYDAQPGTNPAFLAQQNTLRDAITTALNLHIFQKHADRVKMANLAQMVNVLQALILTDGPKMVLTPTYHVFEMLQVHQGATSLPLELTSSDYVFGNDRLPAVSASASRDAQGRVHLSLVNCDPHQEQRLTCTLKGAAAKTAAGRVLTAATMQAHNTFEAPDTVKPVALADVKLDGEILSLVLPPKSVAIVELQ